MTIPLVILRTWPYCKGICNCFGKTPSNSTMGFGVCAWPTLGMLLGPEPFWVCCQVMLNACMSLHIYVLYMNTYIIHIYYIYSTYIYTYISYIYIIIFLYISHIYIFLHYFFYHIFLQVCLRILPFRSLKVLLGHLHLASFATSWGNLRGTPGVPLPSPKKVRPFFFKGFLTTNEFPPRFPWSWRHPSWSVV